MASSPLGREYLPSPSAKTPPANAAVHAFFTPRRPLGTIGFNSPSRTHLLSPDESPSRRCKRARLESSPFAPRNRDALVGTEERPQPEPVSIPEPRKRIRPNTTSRVLMRELDGFGGRGMRYRGNHCSDWRSEVDRFYSRPEDICSIIPDEEPPSLPFSTQACNRSTLVAVGDEAGKVRLIESGKDEEPGFREPYLTLDCHDNAIFDMSWSADDRLLATSSGDQSCRIFDVASQTWLNIFRGHTNSIKTISFNPFNPSLLASTSRDGLCNIWDLRISGRKHAEAAATVTLLDPIRTMEAGATADSSVTAALWIAEHRIATTCQSDAVIRVWDLKTAFSRRRKYKPIATSTLPPAHELPNHRKFALTSLSISPDYQRMYALCKDNNIYAYATNHLQNGPMHAYSHPRLHASTFYVKADISRDGRLLASGSGDGVVTVFPTDERYLDPTSYGNFMHEKDAAGLKVGRGAALVRGHEKEVTDVSWTVDGDLVSISDDYHVRCWRQGERGVEAQEMRGGGEAGGRRWGWGWAEVEGEEGTEETVEVVAEDRSVPDEESNAVIPN